MRAQVMAALAGLLVQMAAPAAPGGPATPAPPTVADPLRGLDLWQGAKVGMRLAEVRRRFPAARPPLHAATLTGGQVDRLQLDGVALPGRPGVAHFFFDGDELSSVELTAHDFRPGRPRENMAAAQAIARAYAARYGAGYDCGPQSLGDVNVFECKWLSGPLSIQLWYMDVAGQAPLFYVAYKQADNPSYNL